MNFNSCSPTAALLLTSSSLMFGGRKSRGKKIREQSTGWLDTTRLSRSSIGKVVECKMNANTTCNWSVDIIFMPFRMVAVERSEKSVEHTKNVKLLFFKPFSSFPRTAQIYIKVHNNVRHNYHKWHRACLRCENNNSIFPSTPDEGESRRR